MSTGLRDFRCEFAIEAGGTVELQMLAHQLAKYCK
jgi:hypothetical protein